MLIPPNATHTRAHYHMRILIREHRTDIEFSRAPCMLLRRLSSAARSTNRRISTAIHETLNRWLNRSPSSARALWVFECEWCEQRRRTIHVHMHATFHAAHQIFNLTVICLHFKTISEWLARLGRLPRRRGRRMIREWNSVLFSPRVGCASPSMEPICFDYLLKKIGPPFK